MKPPTGYSLHHSPMKPEGLTHPVSIPPPSTMNPVLPRRRSSRRSIPPWVRVSTCHPPAQRRQVRPGPGTVVWSGKTSGKVGEHMGKMGLEEWEISEYLRMRTNLGKWAWLRKEDGNRAKEIWWSDLIYSLWARPPGPYPMKFPSRLKPERAFLKVGDFGKSSIGWITITWE